MGTRSLVTIIDEHTGKKCAVIYRQYNGYPTGMGSELQKLIGNATIVNGFSDGEHTISNRVFNGMRCLAAYLVGRLKKGKIGNVYLFPVTSPPEEYNYRLYTVDGRIYLKLTNYTGRKVLYQGLLSEFNAKQIGDK